MEFWEESRKVSPEEPWKNSWRNQQKKSAKEFPERISGEIPIRKPERINEGIMEEIS